MQNARIVNIFLRLSISSVFFYAAIAATLQPYNWVGYIPTPLSTIAPTNILLLGFSLYQLILAIWILSGWKTFYSALFSSLTLIAIIVANFSDIDILFRDFAIFFSSVALAIGSYKKK